MGPDPRSKLAAGPLAERLRAFAEERSIPVEALAGSQVLAAEVRSVLGRREVKAETVERVARHILKTDPQDIYGDAYTEAAKHAGRRVNDRDACFDLCFSDVKSGSLFYAGADEATRREYVATRQEAIKGALGWLEQHAVGVLGRKVYPRSAREGSSDPAAPLWPSVQVYAGCDSPIGRKGWDTHFFRGMPRPATAVGPRVAQHRRTRP